MSPFLRSSSATPFPGPLLLDLTRRRRWKRGRDHYLRRRLADPVYAVLEGFELPVEIGQLTSVPLPLQVIEDLPVLPRGLPQEFSIQEFLSR